MTRYLLGLGLLLGPALVSAQTRPQPPAAPAARYLAPGQKLTTSVDGIGELVNVAVQEKTAV